MSAHTPGKWIVVPMISGSENHRGFRIINSEGWALATVQPVDSDGIEGGANAALMAAAPDLLRELGHLVKLLEPKEAAGGLNVPGLATLNGARAAIAKAQP